MNIKIAAAIIISCSGLFSGCYEKAKEEPKKLPDLPWVWQCGAPPSNWRIVTNELGYFAVSNVNGGPIIGISTHRQDAINHAWQYEMWVADQATKPAAPEYKWR